MKNIVNNKYLNALLILVLFSAIVHMIILFCLAVYSRNFYVLNYFNILDFDLFFPGVFDSFFGNIFSGVVVIIIYVAILKFKKYS